MRKKERRVSWRARANRRGIRGEPGGGPREAFVPFPLKVLPTPMLLLIPQGHSRGGDGDGNGQGDGGADTISALYQDL